MASASWLWRAMAAILAAPISPPVVMTAVRQVASARLGELDWHASGERLEDLWVAEKNGPEGEDALVIRAFPGKDSRWISSAVRVEPGRAYCFSALVKSELTSAEARLELVFRDAKGAALAEAHSRHAFLGHGWAPYEVGGVAPPEAQEAVLRFWVGGPQGNSGGQALFARPKFAPTVVLRARLDARANLVEAGRQAELEVELAGADGDVPIDVSWQVVDFDGRPVRDARGEVKATRHRRLIFGLPTLPAGYYCVRLEAKGEELEPARREISVAVLEPLAQLPPTNARICLDAGMSWGPAANPDRLDTACYVCATAGLRLLRDRLSWNGVEPQEGEFRWGQYAAAAEAQARHGITVYQVFHDCAGWALMPTADGQPHWNMPPRNPIYIYRFVNRLVRDLGDKVRYFEVWNEPNIGFFMGRAEDYAAILKAAYLGAKDADPTLGVLIGSAAGTPGPFYDQVYDNNAGEYFDIYNQHWYGGPEALFGFLASVRGQLAAHGLQKPMWMTEMGMRAYPAPDGSYAAVEREQASYLARAYACGFAAGIARFHYFYLQEFLEGSVSLWGIVRDDLTPKPAYAALAALIRQLGEAQCLGYREIDGGYLIVFRRAPGEAVAMVWGREGQQMRLPARGPVVNVVGTEIEAGRAEPGLTVQVSPMPVYVRGIAPAEVAGLNLAPPAPAEDWQPAPDPDLPRKHVWVQAEVNPDQPRPLWNGEDRLGAFIEPGKPFTVAAWVHNYTAQAVTARVTCEPDGVFTVQGDTEATVEAQPWSRVRHDFVLIGKGLLKGRPMGVTLRMVAGDSRDHARVNLQTRTSDVDLGELVVLFDGEHDFGAWAPNASGNVRAELARDTQVFHSGQACLRVTAEVIGQGDCWNFPRLHLPEGVDLGRYQAVELWTYIAPGGEFSGALALQFIEEDGGTYIVGDVRGCHEAGWQRAVVPLSAARPTEWGPDPDGVFEPSKVRDLLVGWGGRSGRVGETLTFWVDDIRAGN